jgi:hypothetical protein
MGLIGQILKVGKEYLAGQECRLWREFMTAAETAYRKDGDHRFIIGALQDTFTPMAIRRRIIEMLFQRREMVAPEWDAFGQVVTLSTPPPMLRFIERTLQELPRSQREFLDPTCTQHLNQLLWRA